MNQEHLEGVRQPAVAGRFYPDDAGALTAAITDAFRSPLGPGLRDFPFARQGPRRVMGLVAPHAGYLYSGAAAAWAYATLADDGWPEVVVLLGVNHRGVGAKIALSPARGWQTPLGVVPVHQQLAEALQAYAPDVHMDRFAHQFEHSIEVQLPFLQVLFRETTILPILLGDISTTDVLKLGQGVAALTATHDVLVVASSDLSHYVSAAQARHQDQLALQQIAEVDPLGLMSVVAEQQISMCGVIPVAVLLAMTRVRGIGAAKILHYHTSGDVTGDQTQVVGYGAAVVYSD